MTTPRTVAGQAALSGMRPHVKRALAQTILAIEDEAIAPYLTALREADRVLEIPRRQRRDRNMGHSIEGGHRQAGWGRTSAGDAPSRDRVIPIRCRGGAGTHRSPFPYIDLAS
jgi:hypothetical protein